MVPAITGIQWVTFAALVVLLLLVGCGTRRNSRPKQYRSPALSKLPPASGSDYVAPPKEPFYPGTGWDV